MRRNFQLVLFRHSPKPTQALNISNLGYPLHSRIAVWFFAFQPVQ